VRRRALDPRPLNGEPSYQNLYLPFIPGIIALCRMDSEYHVKLKGSSQQYVYEMQGEPLKEKSPRMRGNFFIPAVMYQILRSIPSIER